MFNHNRAETEMMRYMRRLSDRDLALDRAMIPLGSCTMKLNAAAEMIPVSWPEFANIHPFAPAEQMLGYAEMVADLSAKLCAVTGYDAVSMQPNSGAQGEYSGLLTIRAWHRGAGRGRAQRLPDPDLGAWHQSGLGADGGDAGGGGEVDRLGRCRSRRFRRAGPRRRATGWRPA